MLSVCNYHYIRKDFSANYASIFGLTPSKFKNQLNLLKNQAAIISPKYFIDNQIEILKSNENFILITFDDGLKEQFDLAIPIMEDLNLEALFFVNSINFEEKKVSTVHKIHLLRSIISSENLWTEILKVSDLIFNDSDIKRASEIYRFDDEKSASLKYYLNFKLNYSQQESIIKPIFDSYFNENKVVENLYMSNENLIYLSNNNCLGSHTHSHFPVGLLPTEKAKFELLHSKNYLEKLTGNEIKTVSYPYGTREAATNQVADIAKKCSYKFGFTTTKGTNNDNENPLLLNRFDCNDLIGGKNFKQ